LIFAPLAAPAPAPLFVRSLFLVVQWILAELRIPNQLWQPQQQPACPEEYSGAVLDPAV
jgi:hypothetical protein